jgi:hypothetical protein
MSILTLPGWSTSTGVDGETGIAKKLKLDISLVNESGVFSNYDGRARYSWFNRTEG